MTNDQDPTTGQTPATPDDTSPCPECGGSGKKGGERCDYCNGSGRVKWS